ncbi:MAG: hypothetical protein LWX00_09705, partial [Spirochaetia bacterium]|nr:hypothetical protein [Spirochaetia bacterium]
MNRAIFLQGVQAMTVQQNIEPNVDCAIVFISDDSERYASYFGSMQIPYCRFEFAKTLDMLPYSATPPSAGVVFIIDCASIGKVRSKELINSIFAKNGRISFKIMVISRNICEADRADVLKIDALLHDPPDPKELYFKLNRLAGDLLLASAAAVGASSPNDCLLIVKKDGEIISSSSCADHAFLGISELLPGTNVLDVLKKTLSAFFFEKVAEFFKNCDSSPLHISIQLNDDYFPIVFSRENQSNGHITVVLSSENYRDIA